MGGNNATKISGQVAIGARIPIITLPEFGGAAAKVWETLSAGEDLPNRDEINLMAQPWSNHSAKACVDALLAQIDRRHFAENAPKPILSILGGLSFIAALAIVSIVWGGNDFKVWMLFIAPLLAGVSGAAIRPIVDHSRGADAAKLAPYARNSIPYAAVIGFIAGLTSDAVFGKLLGMEAIRTLGITGNPPRG
jgi:hypothetical protein